MKADVTLEKWRALSLLLVGAAASAYSAVPRAAGIEAAEMVREQQTLQVRWTATMPVDVYVASAPDAPAPARQRVSRADADGVHVLGKASGPRRYVWLQAQSGEGRWVAERVLPLEGGRNFRDMGGYPTEDGRYIAWGRIYRSGTMANLSEADYSVLRQLGIAVICDLRSPQERSYEPTQWQKINPSLQYLAWERPMVSVAVDKDGTKQDSAGKARSLMSQPISDPQLAREAFKANYRQGAYEFKEQYRAVFDQLVDGKAPLAFNCSAGKDRTGRIAALLLTALGVPREIVVADYAMSEQVVDFSAAFSERQDRSKAKNDQQPSPYAMMQQWSPEARAVLLSSKPEFIEAMFEQIEADYGSVQNFLAKELGVDDAKLARLKTLYLQG
ncbi:MAG: tyrosine-protein phosphatase [Panacagrimonas sp.]